MGHATPIIRRTIKSSDVIDNLRQLWFSWIRCERTFKSLQWITLECFVLCNRTAIHQPWRGVLDETVISRIEERSDPWRGIFYYRRRSALFWSEWNFLLQDRRPFFRYPFCFFFFFNPERIIKWDLPAL